MPMPGNTEITVVVDEDRLCRAKALLEGQGVSLTAAVNLFLNEVVAQDGLPIALTHSGMDVKAKDSNLPTLEELGVEIIDLGTEEGQARWLAEDDGEDDVYDELYPRP